MDVRTMSSSFWTSIRILSPETKYSKNLTRLSLTCNKSLKSIKEKEMSVMIIAIWSFHYLHLTTNLCRNNAAYLHNLFIIDDRESLAIDQFMRNTADRWRSVSMELRCVQSMLEEVLAYWKRWNFSVDEFENWLEKASAIRNQSEEEKMEFFQVIITIRGRIKSFDVGVLICHTFI